MLDVASECQIVPLHDELSMGWAESVWSDVHFMFPCDETRYLDDQPRNRE